VAPFFPEDPNRAPADGPALPAKALLMIDRIGLFVPDGGPHGLGYVQGEKAVDPKEWFFAAHFFQDPVCPGSLGLESFLQVLKFAALRRLGARAKTLRFAPALGENHRWTYRGQILPANKKIGVEAVVTRIEEAPEPLLMADGLLRVDGMAIYRMENFGVRLVYESSL
jgi:3-hydroxymyristoyl/3-hydroxydecanoyl-(acyl carrier protein) dehydratase